MYMIDISKIDRMEICEIEDLIDILFSKVEEKEKNDNINRKAIIEEKLHNELGIPERFKLSKGISGRYVYLYGKSLDTIKSLRDDSYLKKCINPETIEAYKITDVMLNNAENSKTLVPEEVYGFDGITCRAGYVIKLRDKENKLTYKTYINNINGSYLISSIYMRVDDFFYITEDGDTVTIFDDMSVNLDPMLFYYSIDLMEYGNNFTDYDSIGKEVCKIIKEGPEQLKNKIASRLCRLEVM